MYITEFIFCIIEFYVFSLACRVESNSFILISQFLSFGGDERFLGEAFRVAVLSGFGDFCST